MLLGEGRRIIVLCEVINLRFVGHAERGHELSRDARVLGACSGLKVNARSALTLPFCKLEDSSSLHCAEGELHFLDLDAKEGALLFSGIDHDKTRTVAGCGLGRVFCRRL